MTIINLRKGLEELGKDREREKRVGIIFEGRKGCEAGQKDTIYNERLTTRKPKHSAS